MHFAWTRWYSEIQNCRQVTSSQRMRSTRASRSTLCIPRSWWTRISWVMPSIAGTRAWDGYVGSGQEPPLGLLMGIHHGLHHCESTLTLLSFVQNNSRCPSPRSWSGSTCSRTVTLSRFPRLKNVRCLRGGIRLHYPNQVAECPLPIWQCGAFTGVFFFFLAGPITNRLGYRLTTHLEPGSYECHHFHFLLCG